jgi:hypothetical protein
MQISTGGGRAPVWAADGRELFFLNGKAMMVAQTSDDFASATPKVLFERGYVQGSGGARNYDVAPDGQRFLMIKEVGRTAEPPPRDRLIVVLNWADEVRQAVTAAK